MKNMDIFQEFAWKSRIVNFGIFEKPLENFRLRNGGFFCKNIDDGGKTKCSEKISKHCRRSLHHGGKERNGSGLDETGAV